MQNELENKIKEMDIKLTEIYISVEKTRKYFLWTLITTVVVLVLPIIGLMFAIPSFLANYQSALNTLGN